MRRLLLSSLVLVGTLAVSSPALAGRSFRGGAPMELSREQRTQMLKKLHTGFVVELGQVLELETADTVKLADRLKKFEEQRIQLRLDIHEAMASLRKAAKEGGSAADAPALARRVAKHRVQLAQLDQSEMEEVFKGLSPEKVAKAAVFMAEYPRRIEHLARELQRDRWMRERGSDSGKSE